MQKSALIALAIVPLFAGSALAADPVRVVAAENFYGDVAEQLGGPNVRVTSILTNPDQDPHLFEASASTARDLAGARLVIFNGADYDPWMTKLLGASKPTGRRVIEVARLMHRKAGDNPHLWYDPATMPMVAKAIVADLAAADPAHKADYEQRLAAFTASLKPLDAAVAAMRKKFAGTPVTATEPVFGYMATVLGLKMRNERFQLAIMNNAEPSASDIAAFSDDLKKNRVRVLLYNSQTSEALTQRMQKLAQESRVPVVGVSETEPPGKTYQDWMTEQLDRLDKALASPAS
ncbi:MAG: zinc ABC transporter substrate-binding protein [Alphaproteobacteria bacterium]|nr:zinc ABC transporter substrate-binding protein [Alphaproteobacteria bacterium]